MDQTPDSARLKELLDAHHAWPSAYTFKFIVPEAHVDAVRALLPDAALSTKTSAKGAYVAVTLAVVMPSSDAVLAVYARAQSISGIIAL